MPDDVKTASRYEQDFAAWAREQAAALRAVRDAVVRRDGHDETLDALDWENLAEEIEGLARRDRRELVSRLATIMDHMLKLEFSSAPLPRSGWVSTVRRERAEVREIVRDSPSLGREVPAIIERTQGEAVRRIIEELVGRGELSQVAATPLLGHRYAEQQIMGDWIPGPPAGLQPIRRRRHAQGQPKETR